jgi:putative membrane protein
MNDLIVLLGEQRPKDSADIAKAANKETANYCEIKLAQLALNRSKDTQIKDMAKMLEADHAKVIADLKAYAGKNGISVPLEETTEQRDDLNKLAEEADRDKFDEKWCEKLKDNHRQSISNFEARLDRAKMLNCKTGLQPHYPSCVVTWRC